MGGAQNKHLTVLSKGIWDYLLSKEIKITAEYLLRLLNVVVDTRSRTVRDANEWILNLSLFQKICSSNLTPITHFHLMETKRINKKGNAFLQFCLLGPVLKKIQLDQARLIVVAPGWKTQTSYHHLLQMSIKNPLLLPSTPNQLIEKQNLQLLAWAVLRKSYLQKDYQKSLPSLLQMAEDQGQSLITNWYSVSGIAGVVGEKLIPLDVL